MQQASLQLLQQPKADRAQWKSEEEEKEVEKRRTSREEGRRGREEGGRDDKAGRKRDGEVVEEEDFSWLPADEGLLSRTSVESVQPRNHTNMRV